MQVKARSIHEAQDLAHTLFRQYGLYDWQFQVGKAKRRLGVCKYRSKTIEVSRWVFELCPENVDNTVRHEVAHAIAGYKAGHGPEWKRVARELGANPKSCAKVKPEQTAPKRWVLQCPKCGWEGYGTYRRRSKRYRSRCCKETFLNKRVG